MLRVKLIGDIKNQAEAEKIEKELVGSEFMVHSIEKKILGGRRRRRLQLPLCSKRQLID